MDSYEQYEKECARIREEKEKLLDDFAQWLGEKNLTQKTIDRHIGNVEFYINEFLLYEDAIEAADGIDEIGHFLGFWFIKKALWSSKSQIKGSVLQFRLVW